jgi:rsbT co-antagonist protein RsbR
VNRDSECEHCFRKELLSNVESLIRSLRNAHERYSLLQVSDQDMIVRQTETLLSLTQALQEQIPPDVQSLTEAQADVLYETIETIEEQREQFSAQAMEYIADMKAATQRQIAIEVMATFTGIGVALAGMGVLTLFLLWLIERSIVRPLRHLSAAAAALAEGRSDQPITITSEDEVGALQRAFNQMTDTIRRQTRDLERLYQQAIQSRDAIEAAHRQVSEQLAIIQQQRDAIRELSVPVLPINRDTLVMPLVGALDTARLSQVQEQALGRLAATGARRLLLDVTGVPVIDTQIAQGLIRVVQAARLLGAQVVLVGIRPEVVQSIVGLGVHLNGIRSFSDLQSALKLSGDQG